MKILVLSPHRDDAAFSVALAMRSWIQSGHAVEVLNIFTRSTYAPSVDETQVNGSDRVRVVSEIRNQEDLAMLEQLPGVKMQDAALADAPLRLSCAVNEVCDLAFDPEDEAIVALQRVISRFTDTNANVALVIPLALGHHVDHCLVHHAALPANKQVACAFYEDLPYATRPGAREELALRCQKTALVIGQPLRAITSAQAGGSQWKLGLARLYRSQINDAMARIIAGHAAQYGGSERLWVNPSWLACDVSTGWKMEADDERS